MIININVIKLFKEHINPLDWEILHKNRAIKKYCKDYCKYHNIDSYEELKRNLNAIYIKLTIQNGFVWSKINEFDYYVKLNHKVLALKK